jgi:hypothetical protein
LIAARLLIKAVPASAGAVVWLKKPSASMVWIKPPVNKKLLFAE